MQFREQITKLFKEARELKEICARKDECIYVLETTMEHLEVTVDSYTDTIEALQVKVCHCNKNVVRIVSERELRDELLELEYISKTGEEEELKTPPVNYISMVIDGYTPRGMFPVTINLTMITEYMSR